MAATDVKAMDATSVDDEAAKRDERTPLLQNSAASKPKARSRPYSESDRLMNGTPVSSDAYSVHNQQLDSAVGNGSETPKHEGSQHCHRDKLKVTLIDYAARRKLIIASTMCLAFMIGEVVGGVLANSLAIATDAAHLLTDFASFLISLFALLLAARPPTKRMSFGWYRAEIMGALLSVLLIWVVTGVLVYMAIQRVIWEDYEIDATVMLITAGIGVVFNFIMGFLLHDHGHGHSHGGNGASSKHNQTSHSHFSNPAHQHASDSAFSTASEQIDRTSVEAPLHSDSPDIMTNVDAIHIRMTGDETSDVKVEMPNTRNINVRAAFIHVVGDLFQSLGVLTAAYIIYYKPEWKIADPICTFIFSVLVLFTTVTIMKDILNVLMEGAPNNMSFNEVKNSLCSIKGVREVHNLRLWSLTVNRIALSAHLALDNTVNSQEILAVANHLLHDQFGIYECTIQTEDYMDEMNDCIHCRDPKD